MPNAEVARAAGEAAGPDPVILSLPTVQSIPFVYSSPHSGTFYPPDFLAAARLDHVAIRRSEDSFVDELFAAVPLLGAPLVAARYARAFCDVNREPYELDPAMFEDELPAFANTTSLRVAGGHGTIARVVGAGAEIYRGKLTFAEADRRIRDCYQPYHAALGRLLAETRARFGVAVLIDCHSMPSTGGPLERDSGRARPDIVLGDRYGSACAPELVETATRALQSLGYRVSRNAPYAGGFNTYHYGRPAERLHALQIEINRGLYMDEERLAKKPGFARLAGDLERLVAALSAFAQDRELRPAAE
ncbi:N-formylglutamate amidohydrolase [Desertibaculum subflavum]|uniref:N-formylglutamate amidohydrolase n=1 Tax=Desertibaculum subflavum TaxID=2268458 RepID=UPI000E66F63A